MLLLGAWFFVFACAGTCGAVIAHLICARREAFEDGPEPMRLHPVIPVVLFAALGALLAARGIAVPALGTIALLGVPLVGAWQADALKGIVPDELTLIPLALVAIVVFYERAWGVAFSALVIFIAFALASLISKGRGMGWGDTKLATLCAAVLSLQSPIVGLTSALLTLAVACFAATIVSLIRDRGAKPIAFAPYIVAGVFVALYVTVYA